MTRSARPIARALTALSSLALCAPLAADVIVYDGTGGGFTNLATIVNGAQDGDTIVVRGSHRGFTIDGKSLTVVADGTVTLDGSSVYGPGFATINVRNLAPDQRVVVRGFRSNYGVTVTDCAGSVWLDDIVCTGGAGICTSGTSPGVSVLRSAAVTLTRCSAVGETGAGFVFTAPTASPGLSAVQSGVTLFDCQLTGGVGAGTNSWSVPRPGAAGVRLDASTLTLSGCMITGGGGGLDLANLCSGTHASGGPGIEFTGGPSTLRSAESTAAGGATSLEPLCPGQSAPAGPAILGSGTIVALPGYARHLQANSPVRGGEQLTLTVDGRPGEVPWILVSQDHQPLYLAGFTGMLLVALPQEELFVLPALPAGGQTSLSFAVPNVGASVGALTYHAQAVFLDPAPRVWLGAGTTIVLLDSSY